VHACHQPWLSGIKAHHKHAVQTEVSFIDGNVPILEELLATGTPAKDAYGDLIRVLSACKKLSFTSGGQTVKGSVGAMSFPRVGQQSSAFAMSLSTQGTNIGFDLVLFKTGAYVGVVLYGDLGTPDPDQFQAFVTEAVNKVEGKPTVTPTTF
jgi:hypothetical protein